MEEPCDAKEALILRRWGLKFAASSVFVLASLVLVAFLAVIRSSEDTFLPQLGSNLLCGRSMLHVQPSWQQEEEQAFIQDVVALPEYVLILIRTPNVYRILDKKYLSCIFGNTETTQVLSIEQKFQSISVRCSTPMVLENDAVALYEEKSRRRLIVNSRKKLLNWKLLVFESLTTAKEVVLFAKGIVKKRAHKLDVKGLRCVFDGTIETRVTTAAQEVFRCPRPINEEVAGKKVTLKVNGSLVPSAAYYEPTKLIVSSLQKKKKTKKKKHFLCACTMIFNVAKFLKEWVIYHAHMGVENFIFYDNNSEDNLEEVLSELKEKYQYSVRRDFWPWPKTQEAGFSHCAIEAASQCKWMMFIDVDEFVFPNAWLRNSSNGSSSSYLLNSTSRPLISTSVKSPLVALIEHYSSKQSPELMSVGEISMKCRVYGPSGQKKHPKEGVTQGYTCRQSEIERHKSIALVEAIDESMLNVVHHFRLKKEYVRVSVKKDEGMIHHYKYQAWDEFKLKFRRRVSAYVADWKEERNLESRDRTPGLGIEEIEPRHWASRFCQVNDTSVRDYVLHAFTSFNGTLPWQ